MPLFRVRLIADGKARTLEIDAPDGETARILASARGRVLDVTRRRGYALQRGIGRNERHILFIRLASMLESKVGLADALRRIEQSFGGRLRQVAAGLADAVELGDDLATAMARRSQDFPETVVALVRTGGFGDGTPAALRTAAAFEEEMGRARERLGGGLLLAVGHALVAASIMVGTAYWLTPMLMEAEVFRSAKGAANIDWVETVADVATSLALAFIVVLLTLAGLATLGRRLAPAAVERMILAIPFFRDLALGLRNYVTFFELSLLIQGGIGIDRALRIVADGSPEGAMRRELLAAAQAVTSGLPWPGALRGIHPTDRASLAAAANREEISRTLRALATEHRDLYLFATSVVDPVLRSASVVLLGIAGAVLFGLTVLPILQLAEHLARTIQ